MNPLFFLLRILFAARRRLDAGFSRLVSWYVSQDIEADGGSVMPGLSLRKRACIRRARNSNIKIGANLILEEDVSIFVGPRAILEIGNNVYIGKGSYIISNQEVRIGDNAQIAHHVTIVDTDHILNKDKNFLTDMVFSPIKVADNSWIGAGAIILRGAVLGKGAILGAGAVLRGTIPENKIAVGSPVRILEKR